MKLNQRIAIIGAGAAGLSAAEALKEKGYKNVVLFERNERAGGKCFSVKQGRKIFEMGAGVLTKNNKVPLALAKKYEIPFTKAVYGNYIYVNKNGEKISVFPYKKNIRVLWQALFRYKPLFKKYDIYTPGFSNLEPELTESFQDFAKRHKIEALASMINLFFTGFGYNYIDEVPAAYVLKYANWKTVVAYLLKQAYVFPKGIQSIWNRVAEEHEVRYGVEIKKIQRGKTVVIETNKGQEEFDSLIVSSPLDELGRFMDLSKKTRNLFSRIQTVDYQATLCSLKGFPLLGGFVPENFTKERSGHPVFWYHRHDDENVISFYSLGSPEMSKEEIYQKLNDLVENMGGEIEVVHKFIRWKYFPHVNEQDLKEGFYDHLESLQGKKHSYYIGELMNFSCVGFTAEYADDLVKRFF